MKKFVKLLSVFLLSCVTLFLTVSLAVGQQSGPVKLSIIDVAGNLQLTQTAIEAFKEAHPEIVSDIEFMKQLLQSFPQKLKHNKWLVM